MTTLVIARHGNTFAPGETPRRIGARTDMPLVEKGREQAQKIGVYLKESGLRPDIIYTSNLRRTIETARYAKDAAGISEIMCKPLDIFDEIDHGPDEGKAEEEVVARIGEEPLNDWNKKGIAPPDWRVDPQQIKKNWRAFAADMLQSYPDGVVFVVTSGGIARFAPVLTGDFEGFAASQSIKVSPGGICVFRKGVDYWDNIMWNHRP